MPKYDGRRLYWKYSGIFPAVSIKFNMMRITGEFLLKEYGSGDLYLDELQVRLVEDYEFYMKTVR